MLKNILKVSVMVSLLVIGNSNLNANGLKNDKHILKNEINQIIKMKKNLDNIFKIKSNNISELNYVKELNAYSFIYSETVNDEIVGKMMFITFNNGKAIINYNPNKYQFFINGGKLLIQENIEFQKSFKNVVDFHISKEKKEKIENERKVKENAIKINKIFDAKKDNAIFLNSGKKDTVILFTDPHCPACNNDMSMIEKRLESTNVYVVLTPLISYGLDGKIDKKRSLHPKSEIASSQILTNIKDSMSNKDKIKILKKYFNQRGILKNDKYLKESIKNIKKINEKYLQSNLIMFTPTIVEKTK